MQVLLDQVVHELCVCVCVFVNVSVFIINELEEWCLFLLRKNKV